MRPCRVCGDDHQPMIYPMGCKCRYPVHEECFAVERTTSGSFWKCSACGGRYVFQKQIDKMPSRWGMVLALSPVSVLVFLVASFWMGFVRPLNYEDVPSPAGFIIVMKGILTTAVLLLMEGVEKYALVPVIWFVSGDARGFLFLSISCLTWWFSAIIIRFVQQWTDRRFAWSTKARLKLLAEGRGRVLTTAGPQ